MRSILVCLKLLFTIFAVEDALAIDRHYYIGIVEIEWDYGHNEGRYLPLISNLSATVDDSNPDPHAGHHDMSGMNAHSGHDMMGDAHVTTTTSMPNHHNHGKRKRRHESSDDEVFIKVVFRRFADANFTKMMEHPPEMGLIGPLLVASPGDRLFVHAKNFGRSRFNMHPHLVRYDANEPPGLAPYGGEYLYEWHVKPNDGPQGNEEPCILGAYHSGATSLAAEIEAGLVGPIVICKQSPEILQINTKIAVAIPKIFNESESIFQTINFKGKTRTKTAFPTINGLNYQSAADSNVRIFNNLTCNQNVLLLSFTMGGTKNFHLISTDCGLMLRNGRELSDTLSLYPGGFRILQFSPEELSRFAGDQCLLQSLEPSLKADGLAFPLIPPEIEQCSTEKSETSDKASQSYNLTIKPVKWQLFNCSQISKLRFEGRTEPPSWQGLLGPTISVSLSSPSFKVHLDMDRKLVDSFPKHISLGVKMPSIIQMKSFDNQTTPEKFQLNYHFEVKLKSISSEHEPLCKPFFYEASFFDDSGEENEIFESSSFDTGLFGPLIVCQNDEALKMVRTTPNYFVAPLIIDESRSLLVKSNSKCLLEHPKMLAHTINGLVEPNFGVLPSDQRVNWFFLNVPPLAGREALFQHSLLFEDQGRRNPLFFGPNGIPGSMIVLHGSGKMATMTPGLSNPYFNPSSNETLETWQISCQITGHMQAGLKATFSNKKPPKTESAPVDSFKMVEQYAITAREVDWNYKAESKDSGSGHHSHGGPMDPVLAARRTSFKKLVFRNFFKENRDESDAHLTLLGPVIVLTPEAPIIVTLTNFASKPIRLRPGAGVLSKALPKAELLSDGSVDTGKVASFEWRLPNGFKFPQRPDSHLFPNCVATLYTSDHDPIGDLYAGLVGPLLICPSERKDSSSSEPSIRRFFSLYARFNEAKSSLASLNSLTKSELESPAQPLIFDTVNGRLMGVLDEPGFSAYKDQMIDWIMFAVGDWDDVHMVHYHGSALAYVDEATWDTPRVADTVTLFPGQAITGLGVIGRMQPVAPGTWPIHCHVMEHASRGMMGQYKIINENEPVSLRRKNNSPHFSIRSHLFNILVVVLIQLFQ